MTKYYAHSDPEGIAILNEDGVAETGEIPHQIGYDVDAQLQRHGWKRISNWWGHGSPDHQARVERR